MKFPLQKPVPLDTSRPPVVSDPPVPDVAEQIRRRVASANLTDAERRIAETVLKSFPDAALLSAADIAKLSGVSAASVTRFSTKLGYGNFFRFQEALRSDLRARHASPSKRLGLTPAGRPAATAELLADTFQLDVDNLHRTLELIDPHVFNSLVDHLARARGRLFVTGSKKGLVPSLYFAIQLQQIRPLVFPLDLGDRLTDELLDVHPADTLVAFEPRRATARLIEVVRQFQSVGAVVAVVSDELPPQPLATVDFLLPTATYGIGILDSYVALMSIANAITAALVARGGSKVRDRIERLESLNQAFGTWFDSSGGRGRGDRKQKSAKE